MEVTETCKCGATFNVKGEKKFCEDRHIDFLDAHKKCLVIDVRLSSAAMKYEDTTHVVYVYKKV